MRLFLALTSNFYWLKSCIHLLWTDITLQSFFWIEKDVDLLSILLQNITFIKAIPVLPWRSFEHFHIRDRIWYKKPSRHSSVRRASVLSHTVKTVACLIPDLSSTSACTCTSTWIEMAQLPCFRQEVSRCHTRGESEESISCGWWRI